MALSLPLVVVIIFGTAAAGSGDEGHGLGSGASFIFGDSFVDAGNNNYFFSFAKADVSPFGIDFAASGGQPTGRFCNGRTVPDIVGELLGQSDYSSPFLAPNTTGKAILNGVNYASGGGGILNSTGKLMVNRIGMDVQIDYFNITRQQLDSLLGKEKAKQFLHKKAILSIAIGSNDILNNYLVPAMYARSVDALQTPNGFIDDLITNLRRQLMRLYVLDARKIVVANVGPIGCIPYQKTLFQMSETECVSLPNQLAKQYNGRLRDLLVELNEKLPGSKFLLVNLYDLAMELITNYESYGFKTAGAACCGNGVRYGGTTPCVPTSFVCGNRSEYVFWDPYHSSEAANLILAKQIVDGGTRYVSPMSLRQLIEL